MNPLFKPLKSQTQRSQVTLPKITFKSQPTHHQQPPTPDIPHQHSNQTQEQLSQQISKLDEWSNSLPTAKRKRNQTSQSIMFLYKANNKYNSQSKYKQNNQVQIGPVSFFLAQLDLELAKIKKINYMAIYQNVQYCAGVYRIAFQDVVRKLEEYRGILAGMLVEKSKKISEFQQMKISQLKAKRLNQSGSKFINVDQVKQLKSSQKSQYFTSRFSEKAEPSSFSKARTQLDINKAIEHKNEQMKQIKKMLDRIDKQKLRVLHFCLELGYDIRQDGLAWILKQINTHNQTQKLQQQQHRKQNQRQSKLHQTITQNSPLTPPPPPLTPTHKQQQHIPKPSQFPNFLTQKQINYIISKYKNNFKLKILEEQKQIKDEQDKYIIQHAFQNIRKQRNRKLSMIKEKELLERLLVKKKEDIAVGHKYISMETLRIMQNNQKIKSTTNQIIYAQTRRKLNRYCIQQIHKQPQPESSSKQNKNAQNNERVNKLMIQVRRMLSDANKLKDKEEQIKNEQQKQLNNIINQLRSQMYEGRINTNQRRNPISVIGCLVGWRKAKKILENQLNIFMPAS